MAMVLQSIGVPARSWMGWQIPIRTDDAHGSARIEGIEVHEMIRRFGEDQVAVVAGFQGIGSDGRSRTLGRGAYDTSEGPLAAALQAGTWETYTHMTGRTPTRP